MLDLFEKLPEDCIDRLDILERLNEAIDCDDTLELHENTIPSEQHCSVEDSTDCDDRLVQLEDSIPAKDYRSSKPSDELSSMF